MPVKMDLKGVNEMLAALKKVAPDAKKELTSDLKVIGKIVADEAASKMPRVTGKARRSVKVKVITRKGWEGVQIVEGGSVAPYAPWLDFGGTVGRGRKSSASVHVHEGGRVSVKRHGSRGSGSVKRQYLKDGRYLYPAYFRRYDDMVAATLKAVAKAATSAGLEVKSG